MPSRVAPAPQGAQQPQAVSKPSRLLKQAAADRAIQQLPWWTRNRWYRCFVIGIGLLIAEAGMALRFAAQSKGVRSERLFDLCRTHKDGRKPECEPPYAPTPLKINIEGCSVAIHKPRSGKYKDVDGKEMDPLSLYPQGSENGFTQIEYMLYSNAKLTTEAALGSLKLHPSSFMCNEAPYRCVGLMFKGLMDVDMEYSINDKHDEITVRRLLTADLEHDVWSGVADCTLNVMHDGPLEINAIQSSSTSKPIKNRIFAKGVHLPQLNITSKSSLMPVLVDIHEVIIDELQINIQHGYIQASDFASPVMDIKLKRGYIDITTPHATVVDSGNVDAKHCMSGPSVAESSEYVFDATGKISGYTPAVTRQKTTTFFLYNDSTTENARKMSSTKASPDLSRRRLADDDDGDDDGDDDDGDNNNSNEYLFDNATKGWETVGFPTKPQHFKVKIGDKMDMSVAIPPKMHASFMTHDSARARISRSLEYEAEALNVLEVALANPKYDYWRLDVMGTGYGRMSDTGPQDNGFRLPGRSGPFHIGVDRNKLQHFLQPATLAASSLNFLAPKIAWIDLPLRTGFCPAYHYASVCEYKFNDNTTETCTMTGDTDVHPFFGEDELNTRRYHGYLDVAMWQKWFSRKYFRLETELVNALEDQVGRREDGGGGESSVSTQTLQQLKLGLETDYATMATYERGADGSALEGNPDSLDRVIQTQDMFLLTMILTAIVPFLAGALVVIVVFGLVSDQQRQKVLSILFEDPKISSTMSKVFQGIAGPGRGNKKAQLTSKDAKYLVDMKWSEFPVDAEGKRTDQSKHPKMKVPDIVDYYLKVKLNIVDIPVPEPMRLILSLEARREEVIMQPAAEGEQRPFTGPPPNPTASTSPPRVDQSGVSIPNRHSDEYHFKQPAPIGASGGPRLSPMGVMSAQEPGVPPVHCVSIDVADEDMEQQKQQQQDEEDEDAEDDDDIDEKPSWQPTNVKTERNKDDQPPPRICCSISGTAEFCSDVMHAFCCKRPMQSLEDPLFKSRVVQKYSQKCGHADPTQLLTRDLVTYEWLMRLDLAWPKSGRTAPTGACCTSCAACGACCVGTLAERDAFELLRRIEQLYAMFNIFETSGDGLLDFVEFHKMLDNSAVHPVSEHKAAKMFRTAKKYLRRSSIAANWKAEKTGHYDEVQVDVRAFLVIAAQEFLQRKEDGLGSELFDTQKTSKVEPIRTIWRVYYQYSIFHLYELLVKPLPMPSSLQKSADYILIYETSHSMVDEAKLVGLNLLVSLAPSNIVRLCYESVFMQTNFLLYWETGNAYGGKNAQILLTTFHSILSILSALVAAGFMMTHLHKIYGLEGTQCCNTLPEQTYQHKLLRFARNWSMVAHQANAFIFVAYMLHLVFWITFGAILFPYRLVPWLVTIGGTITHVVNTYAAINKYWAGLIEKVCDAVLGFMTEELGQFVDPSIAHVVKEVIPTLLSVVGSEDGTSNKADNKGGARNTVGKFVRRIMDQVQADGTDTDQDDKAKDVLQVWQAFKVAIRQMDHEKKKKVNPEGGGGEDDDEDDQSHVNADTRQRKIFLAALEKLGSVEAEALDKVQNELENMKVDASMGNEDPGALKEKIQGIYRTLFFGNRLPRERAPEAAAHKLSVLLAMLDLGEYHTAFVLEGYDKVDDVKGMGVEELTGIGMKKGHANRLVKHLRQTQAPGASITDMVNLARHTPQGSAHVPLATDGKRLKSTLGYIGTKEQKLDVGILFCGVVDRIIFPNDKVDLVKVVDKLTSLMKLLAILNQVGS
jgi:hypothetical protein